MSVPVRPTERFFRSVLPMLLVAPDGRVDFANDATARLLELTAAELVGRPLASLGTADSAGALGEALEQARAGRAGGTIPVQLVRAGQPVPCSLTWSSMVDEDGSLSYVSVAVHDQTQAVATERVLQQNEARWRALLEHATDSVWVSDAEGKLIDVPLLSGGDVAWQGRHVRDFVHPDDRPAFEAAFAQLCAGQASEVETELRFLRAGRDPMWARQTMRDLREHPVIAGIVGNVRDITSLRCEQAAARRSQDMFRARFYQSQQAQAVIDPDGRFTAVNDAFATLLGRSADDLLGHPTSEFVQDGDGEEGVPVMTALQTLLAGGLDAGVFEPVVRRADGVLVPIRLDMTLLRDEHGAPYAASAYIQDLSLLRESERRRRQQEDFYTALESLSNAMSLIVDASGEVVYLSPLAAGLLEVELVDLQEKGARDLVHPDDLATVIAAFTHVTETGAPQAVRVRVHPVDDGILWLDLTITNMLESSVGGVVVGMKDVTAEHEAQLALTSSEERFRQISEHAHEGIWTVDARGASTYGNARLEELLGVRVAELADYAPARELAERLAQSAGRPGQVFETDYAHPDGTERCLQVTVSSLPARDESTEALGMVSDVTEARRIQGELAHAALHDTLTELPNRTLVLDRLERALLETDQQTAVLLLDLDRFQQLNEARGHAFGDRVLAVCATALTRAVRPQDTVGRFGGDEFVVVCEDVDERAALQVGHDLLAALASVESVSDRPVHLQASVGVSLSPASASDLLRFADTAMHVAKTAGRGRVRLFAERLTRSAEQRDEIATSLRAAIGASSLEMHYQPVIDLHTGLAVGVEALCRWNVDGSWVPPDDFVGVAASTGLALTLDRWVVQRVLSEFGEMVAAGSVPSATYVTLNLSAFSLDDDQLEPGLSAATASAGLSAGQVVLEITEGAIMENPQRAIALLHRLRELGYQVAIDDFGTGYSSLAYLRDLPVTTLKIDRSFVTDVTKDADALAIASSILELARAVNLRVVAEGVETVEQVSTLRSLGCESAQGWLWSPAVPAAALRDLDIEHHRFEVAGVVAPPMRPLREARAAVERRHGRERLLELHGQGASLATIAAALNRDGFLSPTGVRWHATSVARAISGLRAQQGRDAP